MTLVSTVGGASGPLFGTLFLRMGTSLGDAETVVGAGARGGAAGRARGCRRPRQGRGRATRRCTTRWRPPSTRWTRRCADGADLAGRAEARPGRRRGGPGRDHADAGAQGPGQLPRRAQRRPPGPRRDDRGAAARSGDRVAVLSLLTERHDERAERSGHDSEPFGRPPTASADRRRTGRRLPQPRARPRRGRAGGGDAARPAAADRGGRRARRDDVRHRRGQHHGGDRARRRSRRASSC